MDAAGAYRGLLPAYRRARPERHGSAASGAVPTGVPLPILRNWSPDLDDPCGRAGPDIPERPGPERLRQGRLVRRQPGRRQVRRPRRRDPQVAPGDPGQRSPVQGHRRRPEVPKPSRSPARAERALTADDQAKGVSARVVSAITFNGWDPKLKQQLRRLAHRRVRQGGRRLDPQGPPAGQYVELRGPLRPPGQKCSLPRARGRA